MEKLVYWMNLLSRGLPVSYRVEGDALYVGDTFGFGPTFRIEVTPEGEYTRYRVIDLPLVESGVAEPAGINLGISDTGVVTDAARKAILGALDYSMRADILKKLFP